MLPIVDVYSTLADTLKKHDMALLQAPPGAGKSTWLPVQLIRDGHFRHIVMLEPRRLAAQQANEALMSARTLVVSGVPTSDYDQPFRNQSVDSSVLLADKKLIDLLQLSYMRHDNIHVNFSSMRKRLDGILTLIRAEQGNKQ